MFALSDNRSLRNKCAFEIGMGSEKAHYLQADSTEGLIDWIRAIKEQKRKFSTGVATESTQAQAVQPIVVRAQAAVCVCALRENASICLHMCGNLLCTLSSCAMP